MKNDTNLERKCTVTYDNTLNHLLDGFVGQIICMASGATEVFKEIGKPDELIYKGADDIQEMQVQMMVDHHMQNFEAGFRKYTLDYIRRNKIYTNEEKSKILLQEKSELNES